MYATLANMIAAIETSELIQVTDQNRTGQIDEAAINNALEQASAEINSYLAKIYQLPVTPIPDILKSKCIDIARYNMWSRRGEAPEIVRNRYQGAISWLKEVNAGKIIIDANGVIAAENPSSVELVAPTRLFSRETLQGY